MASANLPCAMNSLARCDFSAKSSDSLELPDCVRIETRQKRSAPAAFIRVPMFQLSSLIGRCVLGRQYAIQLQTEVKTRAQAVMPAPEEKNRARAVACPGGGFPTSQNARRTPKRNCRSSNLALLISRKLPLVISPLGLLKCGELKRLEASIRSCTLKRSLMLTVRNRLKSMFTAPAPNRGFRPTLP